MRHQKSTFKLGRNSSHRKAMLANMLKALVEHGRIETSIPKAKELRKYADRLITIAKKDTLASRRQAISKLRITHNPLNTKEQRAAKSGDTKAYNADRQLLSKLYGEYAPRFKERPGGYTRILKLDYTRTGDGSSRCILEYLPE